MNQLKTRRRINIVLPDTTLDLIKRVAQPGSRSRLIDEAIIFYIEKIGRSNLRKQLKEGALKRAARNRLLSQEWFSIEEEIWKGPKDK